MHNLPESRIAALRTIRKTATTLILMYLMDGQPVNARQVSTILGIDYHTALRYLNDLVADGLIMHTATQSYTMADLGQEFLRLPPENARFSPPKTRKMRDQNAHFAPSQACEPANSYSSTSNNINIKKEEVEGNRQRRVICALRKCGISATTRVKTMLQGNPWLTPGYIWFQRRRLEGENKYSTGLLLQVIADHDPADIRPTAPRRFRMRPVHPPVVTQADPVDPVVDPVLLASYHQINNHSPHALLESIQAELRYQMPKSAYDRFVAPMTLIAFHPDDPEGPLFVVCAANQETRDWLHSRMTSTINRMLTGRCNTMARVIFVTCA